MFSLPLSNFRLSTSSFCDIWQNELLNATFINFMNAVLTILFFSYHLLLRLRCTVKLDLNQFHQLLKDSIINFINNVYTVNLFSIRDIGFLCIVGNSLDDEDHWEWIIIIMTCMECLAEKSYTPLTSATWYTTSSLYARIYVFFFIYLKNKQKKKRIFSVYYSRAATSPLLRFIW